MRALFTFFSIMVFLGLGRPCLAQWISDLNRQAFEDLIKGMEKHAPASPFAAGVSTAEDLTIEDLVLTGVVRNDARSYALISGYLVQVGDRIAGFRVDSIETGKVVLKRFDEAYVLTMGGL